MKWNMSGMKYGLIGIFEGLFMGYQEQAWKNFFYVHNNTHKFAPEECTFRSLLQLTFTCSKPTTEQLEKQHFQL